MVNKIVSMMVAQLLTIMETILSGESKKSVESVCRMFFFLVEIHHGPLSTAKDLHPLLKRVRDLAEKCLIEEMDSIGFNLAAMRYHANKRDEEEKAWELVENITKIKDKRRKKKNKEKALQAAVLQL